MTTKEHQVLYIHALVDLCALAGQGLNDSEDADALRDEMDLWWWEMTPEQIEAVKGLAWHLGSVLDPTSRPAFPVPTHKPDERPP